MDNKELFVVLSDLVKEFDDFCAQHNLRYFLFAGSLLGAIRHQGIIPWDDDVDVCMLREDYEKLKSLSKDFKYPYFLQSSDTDKGYNKTFLKLRNSETTEIPHKDAALDFNHGVFIDIFPLDNVCESKLRFMLQLKELKILEGVLHFHSRYYSKIGALGLKGKKKLAYRLTSLLFKLKLFTPERICNLQNKIASRFNKQKTRNVGTIGFSYNSQRFIYPRVCFEHSLKTKFETIEASIPDGYDEILHKCYGDYMTPSKQPSEHGDVVIDLNTPYAGYVAEHKDDLMSVWKQYHRIS